MACATASDTSESPVDTYTTGGHAVPCACSRCGATINIWMFPRLDMCLSICDLSVTPVLAWPPATGALFFSSFSFLSFSPVGLSYCTYVHIRTLSLFEITTGTTWGSTSGPRLVYIVWIPLVRRRQDRLCPRWHEESEPARCAP